MLSLRGMRYVTRAWESFRLQATESLLERRNLFPCDSRACGGQERREIYHGCEEQQIRPVEGSNPHVAVPDDLFVPVNVKLVRVCLVQDGLEKGGCIFGGALFQTFVGTLVESSRLLCWISG